MSSVTYQRAIARIDQCIAEIKAESVESADPGEWLETGYLAYELEKFIASKKSGTEASSWKTI